MLRSQGLAVSPSSPFTPPGSASNFLDASALDRTLRRIAQEILEHHPDPSSFALIGIPSRGVELATRLGSVIGELLGGAAASLPFCGSVDVSMHRDDLHSRRLLPAIQPTRLPSSFEGKTIVLVDDVLQSGRTCRAAMDSLSSFGRPSRIEYAVLIDRGLRELPISADYTGRRIETTLSERVFVRLLPQDKEEGVWIERRLS